MSAPDDPFEQHLTDELHALADGETAPLGLAASAEVRAAELARQRHHRRVARGGGLALLGAAAVWLLVVVIADPDGGDTGQVRTADGGSTTTTEDDATTTTAGIVVAPDETTTSVRPRPTTTTVADDPPEPKCVEATGEPNGYTTNPAVAGFIENYYTTRPADDLPARSVLCVDDVTPRVGQVVTATVHGSDPDASVIEDGCGWNVIWGDEPRPVEGPSSPSTACIPLGDGTPAPPAPPPGPGASIERTATHAYQAAGKMQAVGRVHSGKMYNAGRPDPYSSAAYAFLEITVHE